MPVNDGSVLARQEFIVAVQYCPNGTNALPGDSRRTRTRNSRRANEKTRAAPAESVSLFFHYFFTASFFNGTVFFVFTVFVAARPRYSSFFRFSRKLFAVARAWRK